MIPRELMRALGMAKPSPEPAHPASNPLPGLKAIAIAASTGGPQALTTLLSGLNRHFMDMPIFITQHMPPVFTALLAQRLGEAAGRICHEGKDGERVEPGHIYLAPGDFHMTVRKQGTSAIIHTSQDAPEHFCRPAADPMLRSLSKAYGYGLLAIILTGMGSDGLEGAKAVAAAGGVIIAQDEASSVVWGMPRAVAVEKGLCRAVLPLDAIAPYLLEVTGHAS